MICTEKSKNTDCNSTRALMLEHPSRHFVYPPTADNYKPWDGAVAVLSSHTRPHCNDLLVATRVIAVLPPCCDTVRHWRGPCIMHAHAAFNMVSWAWTSSCRSPYLAAKPSPCGCCFEPMRASCTALLRSSTASPPGTAGQPAWHCPASRAY
jgi:hypothetical protein